MIVFPKDFFWGAATSSYQVEGGNKDCDWWEWEKRVGQKDLSGDACRHYELFRQDFSLARGLGHNAHRISIEWSRIEPREGEFLEKEIEHYRQVIASLRENHLEPIVTLHHFTNPLWFTKIGAWENKSAVKYFLRFVRKVVESLGPEVKYWITINEPLVLTYHAYILGVWPPQGKSIFRANKVEDNLTFAHIQAYKLIQKIYREKNLPSPMISISQNMQAFVACTPSLRDKLAVYLRDKWYNLRFLNRAKRAHTLDFIGVNYYSRSLVEVGSWSPRALVMDTCNKNHHPLKKNSLGWDIYPQGLYDLLIKLKKYNLPVMITENGICTDDDSLRWEYIQEHLKNIYLAMQEGVKVNGYLYWSLLDNFEWDKGFGPRFGLVEVDYRNYERKIRESAQKYAKVCRTGILDDGNV